MAELPRQVLAIPIRPHVAAVLDVPFPMSDSDWDQLMAVLAAMKPGLVTRKDTEGESDDHSVR